jgi:hypothetical protein
VKVSGTCSAEPSGPGESNCAFLIFLVRQRTTASDSPVLPEAVAESTSPLAETFAVRVTRPDACLCAAGVALAHRFDGIDALASDRLARRDRSLASVEAVFADGVPLGVLRTLARAVAAEVGREARVRGEV